MKSKIMNIKTIITITTTLFVLSCGLNATPEDELRRAASQGNLAEITRIVAHNSELNINASEPQFGLTALHYAAREGRSDVVQYLLEHGANIAATAQSKNTPLHLASEHKTIKILTSHLKTLPEDERLSIINHRNNRGETPLIVAANDESFSSIVELVKAGADMLMTAQKITLLVDSPLPFITQQTALDFAFDAYNLEAILALFSMGASYQSVNSQLQIPARVNNSLKNNFVALIYLLITSNTEVGLNEAQGKCAVIENKLRNGYRNVDTLFSHKTSTWNAMGHVLLNLTKTLAENLESMQPEIAQIYQDLLNKTGAIAQEIIELAGSLKSLALKALALNPNVTKTWDGELPKFITGVQDFVIHQVHPLPTPPTTATTITVPTTTTTTTAPTPSSSSPTTTITTSTRPAPTPSASTTKRKRPGSDDETNDEPGAKRIASNPVEDEPQAAQRADID